MKIRILIADDHEIFRDGLSAFAEAHPELELVGMARDGKELIDLAAKLSPDVILADIQMPVMDGAEATEHLSRNQPQIPVIALSSYSDDQSVFDMLNAGAKGYLLKHAHKRDIVDAIHSVYKGGIWYCREISEAMLRVLQHDKHHPDKESEDLPEIPLEFSDRDLEIIQMICLQKSNKEMAKELRISVRTVESRRNGIFHKLSVKTPAGVVIYAITHGMFDPETARTDNANG